MGTHSTTPKFEQVGDRIEAYWPAKGGTIRGRYLGNCFFREAEEAMTYALFAEVTSEADKGAVLRSVRAATERGPGVIDKAVIAGYRKRITDAVSGDSDGALWLP